MNLDIADPKCDVEALFISFLKYYYKCIILRDDGFDSLDNNTVWFWIVSTDQETGTARKICDELLSAWNQAGYIKLKKTKYFTYMDKICSGPGVYIFTTKGLKKLRRKRKI